MPIYLLFSLCVLNFYLSQLIVNMEDETLEAPLWRNDSP